MKLSDKLNGAAPTRASAPAKEGLNLTAREREVLRLLAVGLTYKQIAHEIGLSESTVRSHIHQTYQKMGVADRAQAVLKAVKDGLIEATGAEELSLFERTAQSEMLDLLTEEKRRARIRQRKEAVGIALEIDEKPKPWLAASVSDPGDSESAAPPRHVGAIADLLTSINMKDHHLPEGEKGLREVFDDAMSEDGFDRYGRLIKLAAVAVREAVRVRVLTE